MTLECDCYLVRIRHTMTCLHTGNASDTLFELAPNDPVSMWEENAYRILPHGVPETAQKSVSAGRAQGHDFILGVMRRASQ